jgi:hypothetical protein
LRRAYRTFLTFFPSEWIRIEQGEDDAIGDCIYCGDDDDDDDDDCDNDNFDDRHRHIPYCQ